MRAQPLRMGLVFLQKGPPRAPAPLPPREDTVRRRRLCTRQRGAPGCSHAGPRSQTSSLQNREKQTSLLVSYPVCGTSYSSPHGRRQDLYFLYDSFTEIHLTHHTIQPVKVALSIFTKLCTITTT